MDRIKTDADIRNALVRSAYTVEVRTFEGGQTWIVTDHPSRSHRSARITVEWGDDALGLIIDGMIRVGLFAPAALVHEQQDRWAEKSDNRPEWLRRADFTSKDYTR